MKLLILVVLLLAIACAVYLVADARAKRSAQGERWRVLTRTAEDGTLRVLVAGPGGGERLVKELPAALEGAELTSELRLAREEAALQAEELNRGD
jgi:hypothetical protein